MTENEKTELFDKWYDENYDEWAEGEEGIALREELEQAFKGGIAEFENKIADIKANCDLSIEGRDVKIKELETENNKLLDVINNQDVKIADLEKKLEQAKEIIKKFLSLRHDCKEKDCPCESLICETIDERAEQFLKEN